MLLNLKGRRPSVRDPLVEERRLSSVIVNLEVNINHSKKGK